MALLRTMLALSFLSLLAYRWHTLFAETEEEASKKTLPESFTCTVKQPGYHIVGQNACGLSIWKESHRGPPLILNYSESGVCAYAGMSARTEADIKKALSIGQLEPYQLGSSFFSVQGKRIESYAEMEEILTAGNPLFLLEGGQFQWPPVEIGFRHVVEGLDVDGSRVELETLSLMPPVFRVHNLASHAEARELINYAKPHFRTADVVYMDKHKDKKNVTEFRNSLNYRPPHNATPLLTSMEARAVQVTRMPFSHLEALQLLSYNTGGFYHAHDDAGDLKHYMKDRSHLQRKHYGYFDRMLTLFWYLNDVPAGGETNFPRAGGTGPEHVLPFPPSTRACTQGLMVKPVATEAILWYNMYADGRRNPYALHGACAVEAGEKYAINIWIYNKPFATPSAEWDPEHPRMKALNATNASYDTKERERKPNERTLRIENQAGADVQVSWRGNGVLKPMLNSLRHGETSSLNSFVGHTFVAHCSGQEIASYTIGEANDTQVHRFVVERHHNEL